MQRRGAPIGDVAAEPWLKTASTVAARLLRRNRTPLNLAHGFAIARPLLQVRGPLHGHQGPIVISR